MNFIDYALPISAFIVAILGLPSIKEGVKLKHFIIGFILLVIMGFTIYDSWEKSDFNNKISKGNDSLITLSNTLIDQRRVDSINTDSFQTYLIKKIGLQKSGDTVTIINRNTYNSFAKTPQLDNVLTDSSNVYFKAVKDSLYISPKEGAWIKAFFSYDTSVEINNPESQNIATEGSGAPGSEIVTAEGKKYVVNTIVANRVVYLRKPIGLNLSPNKSRYIIFGDQAVPSKRYFYKNGKVTWIPDKY